MCDDKIKEANKNGEDDGMNDWEKDLENVRFEGKYNWEDMYNHSHSELSLQQSKRDQIIAVYLALCTFLIPFALGEEFITQTMKGGLFIILGIVGILLSFITIRYREYKEVYWLCCQCITVLRNCAEDAVNKSTIQRTFYYCINKKGHNMLKKDGEKVKLKKGRFVKANLYSCETMYFVIIAFMAALILSFGVYMVVESLVPSLREFALIVKVLLGCPVFLLTFFYLLEEYFRMLIKIYLVLEKDPKAKKGDENKKRDDMFSNVFKMAWFLHVYYEPIDPNKK